MTVDRFHSPVQSDGNRPADAGVPIRRHLHPHVGAPKSVDTCLASSSLQEGTDQPLLSLYTF
jgi:hypothetical protein